MNKEFLKKLSGFSSYIIFLIIIIVILYLVFNFIMSTTANKSLIEGMGNVENSGNNNILSSEGDNTGILYFKRNDSNPINIEPVHGASGFRVPEPQNYYFSKKTLKTKLDPNMTDDRSINLFFDFFGELWDTSTHKFKQDFINGLYNSSYYVLNSGGDNIYFIKYTYLLTLLSSEGITIPTSFKDQYNLVKKFCSIICDNIDYECFLEPVFKGDVNNWSDNSDFMFFIFMKYQAYPIDLCSSGNNSRALTKANEWVRNAKIAEKTAQGSKFKDAYSQSGNSSPEEIYNKFKKLSTGIPFYLGNSEFTGTGFIFFNAVKITEHGLKILLCNDSNIGNSIGSITDESYIENIKDPFTKYETSFRNQLSIIKSRFNSTQSVNIDDGTGSSDALNWGTDFPFDIKYGSSDSSLRAGNTGGAIKSFGFVSFQQTNRGLKADSMGTSTEGVGVDENGLTVGRTIDVTLDSYPISTLNSCESDFLTFKNHNNNYHTHISGIKNNITELGIDIDIDADNGTVYYISSGNKTILFDINKYDLKSGDLESNDAWCDMSNMTGKLVKGDILGVNGGNNQYVSDPDKKIRFFFDMYGTFHVEISLSRATNSQARIVSAFSQKFNELTVKYPTERTLNRNFLNNFNYSGTSLTHNSMIALMLNFKQILVTHNSSGETTTQDYYNRAMSPDTDTENDIDLFFNKITDQSTKNSPWSKYMNTIDNTKQCNNWFKHSNVYKDLIEIDISGLDIIGENKNHIFTANNREDALNSCSTNTECYGVTCRSNDTNCELWRKGDIKNHFLEEPYFNSTEYDAYYKICPTRDNDLENAEFQQKDGLDFAKTPIAIQYHNTDNANFLNEGNVVSSVDQYAEIQDSVIKQYVSNNIDTLTANINENQNCTWRQYMQKMGKNVETMTKGDKITYIYNVILQNKDQIKILSSMQTDRASFMSELGNQICFNILNIDKLIPDIKSTSNQLQRNIAEKNNLQSRDATNITNFYTTTTNASGSAGSNSTEYYANINEENLNTNLQEKFHRATNKIIKKCIYNIDDVDDNKDINNYLYNNKDSIETINTVILSIFLIIITIVLINMVRNNKK